MKFKLMTILTTLFLLILSFSVFLVYNKNRSPIKIDTETVQEKIISQEITEVNISMGLKDIDYKFSVNDLKDYSADITVEYTLKNKDKYLDSFQIESLNSLKDNYYNYKNKHMVLVKKIIYRETLFGKETLSKKVDNSSTKIIEEGNIFKEIKNKKVPIFVSWKYLGKDNTIEKTIYEGSLSFNKDGYALNF